jgi:hypothetical protein
MSEGVPSSSSDDDPEDWGNVVDYRTVLLQFVGSLTFCEHMGDVADNIAFVLQKLNLGTPDWDNIGSLREQLAKQGITTLHGSSLI